MDQEILKIIEATTENLLQKLDIKAKAIGSLDDQNIACVTIETQEPGLLIGFHGETLYSLQLIIALMVFRKTKIWTRLILEVGDYRQRRQNQLIQMAKNLALRVKQTGQPVSIPYLTSSERRMVHLLFQDDKEVTSESEGEGENRRLTIKPKQTPITPTLTP